MDGDTDLVLTVVVRQRAVGMPIEPAKREMPE
jgi:hypothetical protein